jgi:hypothetical protein
MIEAYDFAVNPIAPIASPAAPVTLVLIKSLLFVISFTLFRIRNTEFGGLSPASDDWSDSGRSRG